MVNWFDAKSYSWQRIGDHPASAPPLIIYRRRPLVVTLETTCKRGCNQPESMGYNHMLQHVYIIEMLTPLGGLFGGVFSEKTRQQLCFI